jgi:uncharacterized membrane-anchored protein YjiN (DUF445 family)
MAPSFSKEQELRRAKAVALSLLLLAAATFVATLFAPPTIWFRGLKAVSEAAMVGALADWFAVVALFRRVPIPLISRHTAIIPRKQSAIANNLALFVQEKFLDPESIVALIRKHDPAGMVGQWLVTPENAARLSTHLLRFLRGGLKISDDERIQAFLKDAFDTMIDKLDLGGAAATLLDSLTRDGRHQELFDAIVLRCIEYLDEPSTRALIAGQLTQWMKRRHPIAEKIAPTDWLGENAAERVAKIVNDILTAIVEDEGHELRRKFDTVTANFIVSLREDPETARKAEAVKHYIKTDPVFKAYVDDIWSTVRGWLDSDLKRQESSIRGSMRDASIWIGQALSSDAALRASLNKHMENIARATTPELSGFLTHHIRDTVNGWDADEMSRQIELNIGKDLQYIRVNGTLVGGLVGFVLFALSEIPGLR